MKGLSGREWERSEAHGRACGSRKNIRFRRTRLVLRIMAYVRTLARTPVRALDRPSERMRTRQKKAQPQGLRSNPPKEEVLEETSDWHPTWCQYAVDRTLAQAFLLLCNRAVRRPRCGHGPFLPSAVCRPRRLADGPHRDGRYCPLLRRRPARSRPREAESGASGYRRRATPGNAAPTALGSEPRPSHDQKRADRSRDGPGKERRCRAAGGQSRLDVASARSGRGSWRGSAPCASRCRAAWT
jgi:hypothetical protein